MNKLLLSLLLLVTLVIFPLDVDRGTIELELDITVEFENYVGPHLFYNSVEDIRRIGSSLADEITPNLKSDADYSGKYVIYHRPKLEWEKNIKSCDIFKITSTALIDNVDNIELILSQYLIDNYGYSLNDSELLAHLLVIYNAVYRADPKHLSENYTVEGAIVEDIENIGLDLQYFNWPGKTNIFIPLSDNIDMGSLTNIDTDEIIDSNIIVAIKLDEEDQIELREEIIEFKEREYDEVSEEIDEEKALIDDLVQEITVENKEEIEETIKEKEEIIAEKEEVLEDKEELILELRDDLSEDKNNLIVKDEENTVGETFPYIINKIVKGQKHGQLINISNMGIKVEESSVNTLRNNYFVKSGDYIYIIAGGDSANHLITLGQLESDSLSLVNWAEIPCYENSTIIINNKKIYSIIEIDSEYYIGEFNKELQLLRRSAVNLIKESYIILKSDVFYIQGEYNSIRLVNLSDFISVSE